MVIFIKLILIGIISGIVLAAMMKIIRILTGNPADILLYNMDYMPGLKRWSEYWITGVLFHYTTCIASAVILFYLLLPFGLETAAWPYILVFSAGGGILYFLSALTETPPAYDDFAAWFYWTSGHAVFGLSIGLLVKLWV